MNQPLPNRFVSLDVFRGITMASMIVVNNPGDGRTTYAPLLHVPWHGWTPTDLIFPFFLFIVGVSITLALERRIALGSTRKEILLPVLRRSLIIFGLGLFLSGFPYYPLATLRIPGVLQRIAICYLIGSMIYLYCGLRGRILVLLGSLFGYWALMSWVPVPGFGPGQWTPEGNLSAYLDRYFLEGHLYTAARVYDPEGILSTLPAIATVLFGILTGQWFRYSTDRIKTLSGLLTGGILCVAVGLIWNLWFPINKNIWTSSFAVFAAGMALFLLAFCYWSVDLRHHRVWIRPFLVFGMNAITVYVLSGLFGRILSLIRWADPTGAMTTLKSSLYHSLFTPWLSPQNASLLWALSFVLLFWAIMWLFYRKSIFLRI